VPCPIEAAIRQKHQRCAAWALPSPPRSPRMQMVKLAANWRDGACIDALGGAAALGLRGRRWALRAMTALLRNMSTLASPCRRFSS